MQKYRRFVIVSVFASFSTMFISLYLNQCTFKTPSAPVWDVDFIIPLISDKYTMEKLADENDDVEIQDNQVLFNIDHQLDPFQVGDYLKTNGAEKSTNILLPDNAPDPFENPPVNDILTLPDSILVDNAIIKSGQVEVTIDNPTDYGVRIDISIPSLQQDGSVIPITFNIEPHQNQFWPLTLDLVEFTPGGTNQIAYSATATITGRTGNQGGNVQVNVNISDIYFQELTGVLNHLQLKLEDQNVEINLPAELEGFRIESADLKLAIRIAVPIPIIADLTIEGINPRNSGYQTMISFQDSITNIVGNGIMVDTLEFPNGQAVADFINGQPEEILISGSLEIGDGQSMVTVTDTNTIKAKVLFQLPLTVTLPNYVTKTDPDTIEIDKDARDIIRDNLVSVNLETIIENHLPLGVKVTLYFDSTTTDSTLYDSLLVEPDLKIGPLRMAPAPVTGTPGFVVRDTTSAFIINLDKDQLKLFERPEVYQGSRLEILGTAGQMVQVRPTDYIDIRANLNAVVRTKIPEDEDDEEGGGE